MDFSLTANEQGNTTALNSTKGKDKDTRRISSSFENSEANWVYLATPFVCCLSRPIACYLGFEKIVERMGECRMSRSSVFVHQHPSLPAKLHNARVALDSSRVHSWSLDGVNLKR